MPALLRRPRLLLLLIVATAGAALLLAYYWPELYLRSARQALDRHDFVAAHVELERYLIARPNHAEAHLLLARLDRRADHYIEAVKHLDACQRLGGFAEQVQLERALLVLQNGDFDERLEQICRRHAVPGDADEFLVLEALSQGYSKTYHLPEALLCLNRMLELQSDSGYALRRRAWIYSMLRKEEQAESDYRRALEVDGNDTSARLGLARILLDFRRDGAAALEQFERLSRVRKDSASVVGLAQSLHLLGRTDEARRLLDDWLREHTDDASALAERGKLALEERHLDVAESLLRRALAQTPDDSGANHTLYLCLIQQGKTDEAEKCQARFRHTAQDIALLGKLMGRLKQNPDDPDLRCQVATIFLRQNQDAEGERWLLATLQMYPLHSPSHNALADYYQRIGRIDLAEIHRRGVGAK